MASGSYSVSGVTLLWPTAAYRAKHRSTRPGRVAPRSALTRPAVFLFHRLLSPPSPTRHHPAAPQPQYHSATCASHAQPLWALASTQQLHSDIPQHVPPQTLAPEIWGPHLTQGTLSRQSRDRGPPTGAQCSGCVEHASSGTILWLSCYEIGVDAGRALCRSLCRRRYK